MPNWNKFQPTLLAKFCIHNFAMLRCRQRQALNGSLQLSVRLLKNKQDAFCLQPRCGFYLLWEQFVETPGLPTPLEHCVRHDCFWGRMRRRRKRIYLVFFQNMFLKEKCSRNWGSFAISPSLKFPIIGFIMRCSTLLFTTRPRPEIESFPRNKNRRLKSSFPYSNHIT